MILDVQQELLPGDRVRLRWTDAIAGQLCEATYTLDELAAMQRGEVIADPAPVERVDLDAAISALEARQEGLDVRRRDLLDQHPELGEEGSQ
jgi:hypothetical protein